MASPYEQDLNYLAQHYSRLVTLYGDSAKGVQWTSTETQEQRMAVLAQVGDLQSARILDLGCGTGHLLAFLRQHLGFAGEYIGYDISADMIATARQKFPGIRFEQRNILADGMPQAFDYVLINGVFNNRLSDNWGFLTALLSGVFPSTRQALAFNALSRYVDFCDDHLYYAEPTVVFDYCKEHLSPRVTLRHDYLIKPETVPFEFTVYVYQTSIKPRKLLRPAEA